MPSKKMRNGKLIGYMAQVRRQGVNRAKLCGTLAEAKAMEAEWVKEIELSIETATHSALEWATAYLKYSQGRYVRKTFEEKREAFDLLVRFVPADEPVDDIGTGHALKLLDAVAEKRSGHAANKVRKNLVAGWNWGKKHLAAWPSIPNPFALIEQYAYQRESRYVPPMEDVQTVLAIMPEPDRTMLLAYLHTGARRDELFRLQWSDVDFATSRIKLWTRKRKGGIMEADTIPMTQALRQALLGIRSASSGQGLVFHRGGRKYTYRRHWLKYWCGLAGVPAFSFHGIRHLTASWLDSHNIPLTTIQAILRHKMATTTAKYLHELRGVQVDLDRVFEPAKVLEMKKAHGIEP